MNKEEVLNEIRKDTIVSLEFMDFILGDLLGWGVSRYVFNYEPDSKYVIKLDLSNYNANVMEYHIWKDIEFTKHAKWFAPVKSMSPCGRIMLQEKCEFRDIDKYPKLIPAYLSDIKVDNFGWIGKRFVCLDYAGSNLITKGLTSKMQKVKWIK